MPDDQQLRPRLGVMFDRDRPPEELAAFAVAVERLGVDDLWVVEDLPWAGSIAAATAALAATERLRVGIGIAPAPLRNPVLLAMEFATVARLFPGRLAAGIGHGVAELLAPAGALPQARLALLEETVTAVRALLRGETVTLKGRAVHLDGVELVHPPTVVPPVLAGVVRPRSLELSGRVAEGTVMAEGQGPDEIAAALDRIDAGRRAAGSDAPHQLVVFTHLRVDDDPERLREATEETVTGHAAWLGVDPADLFLAAGPGSVVAARVRSLWEAGADSVVLRPIGADPLDQVRAALEALGRA
ncbi:LLM class flavin-dependent oxidoreductase [Peterkaempfera bronchialis]|uniref:LLM class flavin-dependent oxidoreductase n=1 Tax=Peterkaempfera bronchialis TaxID=2126346 RepID=A0A345T3H2_9ACTN|nr:LLM class flavin-dependent oxidoreductase [Peterkaempfera bronchialis]AXI80527.1 LLM class flavin-dependent oxidoreductase [Peterkaempfera bronchialis]